MSINPKKKTLMEKKGKIRNKPQNSPENAKYAEKLKPQIVKKNAKTRHCGKRKSRENTPIFGAKI